jgi:hypothetical protein
MSIYKKLQDARNHIKSMNLSKKGFNAYSKYNYYTPEQINYLVNEACNNVGLMTKFDLLRDVNGLHGILTIIDLNNKDTTPEITFKQATDIPQIKATNITQQIGGAVTYTQRYLLMTAFDIVDNNLDFDSQNNTKEKESTGQQGIMIHNLIRTSSIDEKKKTLIESEVDGYSFERAKKCIEYLKANQIDPANPGQKDILNQLNEKTK